MEHWKTEHWWSKRPPFTNRGSGSLWRRSLWSQRHRLISDPHRQNATPPRARRGCNSRSSMDTDDKPLNTAHNRVDSTIVSSSMLSAIYQSGSEVVTNNPSCRDRAQITTSPALPETETQYGKYLQECLGANSCASWRETVWSAPQLSVMPASISFPVRLRKWRPLRVVACC